MNHEEVIKYIILVVGIVLIIIVFLMEIIEKKFTPIEKLVEKGDKEIIKKFSHNNRYRHTYYANIRFFDNAAMLELPLPDGIKSNVMRNGLSDFIDALEKAIHVFIVSENIDFDKIKRKIVMNIRSKDSFFIEIGEGKRFTLGLRINII